MCKGITGHIISRQPFKACLLPPKIGQTHNRDYFSRQVINKKIRTIDCGPRLFTHGEVSDQEMKEIHEFFVDAFRPLCEAEDKKYLDFGCFRKNMKSWFGYLKGNRHYALKDEKNKIVGFYQLEKQGDVLYIESFVIPKKLRGTKTSRAILKCVIDNISKMASDSGYKKIALHVDSRNKPLLKLYEKLGFNLSRVEEDFYFENHHAFYMEFDVNKVHL